MSSKIFIYSIFSFFFVLSVVIAIRLSKIDDFIVNLLADLCFLLFLWLSLLCLLSSRRSSVKISNKIARIGKWHYEIKIVNQTGYDLVNVQAKLIFVNRKGVWQDINLDRFELLELKKKMRNLKKEEESKREEDSSKEKPHKKENYQPFNGAFYTYNFRINKNLDNLLRTEECFLQFQIAVSDGFLGIDTSITEIYKSCDIVTGKFTYGDSTEITA